jgi:hypothetical protein
LRALTLRAIADDYESFQMVVHEVTKWSSERGLTYSEEEIASMLLMLVDEDLARAWRLGDLAERIAVTRKSIADEEVAFIISKKGMDALPEEA